MLSEPAASSRQLIGLCLSKSIELNRNQETLARVSPPGVEGIYPGCIAPDRPIYHPHQHPRPIHFSCWEDEAVHQRKMREQEGAGVLFFFSQTTDLPLCPASHAFICEAFILWLLCAGHLRQESIELPQPGLHIIVWKWDFKGHL